VTGTSAGALNAAAVAAGIDPLALREVWRSISPSEVYTPRIRRAHGLELALKSAVNATASYFLDLLKRSPDLSFSREYGRALGKATAGIPSILDTHPLQYTIKSVLAPRSQQLLGTTKSLVLCATDARAQDRVYYYLGVPPVRQNRAWKSINSLDEAVDALMASTAIPLVFQSRNGQYDGGLTRNQPLSPAMAYTVSNIYVIIPGLPREFPVLGTVDIASSLLAYLTSASLGHQLDLARLENTFRRAFPATTPQRSARRQPCAVKIIRPVQDLGQKFSMHLLSFGHRNICRLMDDGAAMPQLTISTPAL
jgi:predicted acylesterase/phospholipase RssA